jgi:PAS domain-containing protein
VDQITVDAEQCIVLFNGAAERIFLYPAEDAIGEPLDRFIPQREFVLDAPKKSLQGRTSRANSNNSVARLLDVDRKTCRPHD